MTKRYPVFLLGRPLNLVFLQVSFSHAINISCIGSVLTAFAATFNPLHSAAGNLSNTESRKISAVSGDDQCQRRVKLLVFCRLKLGDHTDSLYLVPRRPGRYYPSTQLKSLQKRCSLQKQEFLGGRVEIKGSVLTPKSLRPQL